jgi:hypothetical protein
MVCWPRSNVCIDDHEGGAGLKSAELKRNSVSRGCVCVITPPSDNKIEKGTTSLVPRSPFEEVSC